MYLLSPFLTPLQKWVEIPDFKASIPPQNWIKPSPLKISLCEILSVSYQYVLVKNPCAIREKRKKNRKWPEVKKLRKSIFFHFCNYSSRRAKKENYFPPNSYEICRNFKAPRPSLFGHWCSTNWFRIAASVYPHDFIVIFARSGAGPKASKSVLKSPKLSRNPVQKITSPPKGDLVPDRSGRAGQGYHTNFELLSPKRLKMKGKYHRRRDEKNVNPDLQIFLLLELGLAIFSNQKCKLSEKATFVQSSFWVHWKSTRILILSIYISIFLSKKHPDLKKHWGPHCGKSFDMAERSSA